MNTLPDDNPLSTMPLSGLLWYRDNYGEWTEQVKAEIARREVAARGVPLALQTADEGEFERQSGEALR